MNIDAETKLSLAFAVLALVLGLTIDVVLNQPDWVAIVVVIVVGFVLPRVIARTR